VVKLLDFHTANQGSSPSSTRASHWWHQEQHPVKVSVPPEKSHSYGHIETVE